MPTPITRPSDPIDRLLAAYEATGYLPMISGGDHGDEGEQQEQQQQEQREDQKPDRREMADQLKANPDLQAFVNDLIASERKRTEDKLTADAEAKAQADREAREREEAEKRGDFEKVKTDLTTKVQTVEQERDTLRAERDQYRDLVKADVEAQWSEIPEEVREAYTGDAEDVLAMKQHIQRNRRIIERLTADTRTPRQGNPPNPRPGLRPDEEPASPMSRRQILT